MKKILLNMLFLLNTVLVNQWFVRRLRLDQDAIGGGGIQVQFHLNEPVSSTISAST